MAADLIEEHDRWVLPLEGRAVTRCLIDYSFGLLLDGERSVEVSLSYFRFRDRDGQEHSMNAEEDRRLLAPALACFGVTVAHAYAWKSGQLELAFTDGTRIEAYPHNEYEAWRVSGPDNVLIVSPAGGDEPAVWDGTPGFLVHPERRRELGLCAAFTHRGTARRGDARVVRRVAARFGDILNCSPMRLLPRLPLRDA